MPRVVDLRAPDPCIAWAAAIVAAAAGAACRPATAAPADDRTAAARPAGDGTAAALYDRLCRPCHGERGAGNGPAAPWLWPRPRDFSRGAFKWRTTPTGRPPTDDDLARAIRYGVPGTSMHAFGDFLDDDQVRALVARVKSFAPATFSRPAEPIDIGVPPPVTDELIARGADRYRALGCANCHGDAGRGDGPAAATMQPGPPYDLTARPLRRPGGASLRGIYTSLVTGLDGTAMPSYAGAAPDADLWAVAAYIDSIRYRGGALPEPTALEVAAVRATPPEQLAAGVWPGDPASRDAAVWGGDIAPHGAPPARLAPAQASLHPAQCGRCHAKQLREWRPSLHARAASPGTLGQTARMDASGRTGCLRCHAPLPEQLDHHRPFDPQLQAEGIACAACHLRGWTRFGPPPATGARLLSQPGYPFEPLAIYERADFCLPCHQLPPWNVKQVAGSKDDRAARKPLLNTYREWLEGPYMRRGIQCQHCHMPNREHTFLGVHDPDTFRQGIRVDAIAGRSRATGAVSVRARVTNVGAAHYLPTTPTPAAFLEVELVDGGGRPIDGAAASLRIGRHLDYDGNVFHQLADTRIPPGESVELAKAWAGGRTADAVAARVRVRVEPDEYYERLFEKRLRGNLPAAIRAQFEEALARTRASKYVAVERIVPIADIAGARPKR